MIKCSCHLAYSIVGTLPYRTEASKKFWNENCIKVNKYLNNFIYIYASVDNTLDYVFHLGIIDTLRKSVNL